MRSGKDMGGQRQKERCVDGEGMTDEERKMKKEKVTALNTFRALNFTTA